MARVTRFAPAPTGLLHLGHVVNAIHVWGLARAAAASVLLRVEDHDRQRSRRSFESALLDDLDWLGFVPDQPALETFRAGASLWRQSDRHQIYMEALAHLRAQGLVYACDCTRGAIAAASEPGAELRYPGTCASKGLEERPGLGVRVRLPPSVERFDDGRHGSQEQRPHEQCGDLLVRDREGNWTYQFAVTVDDMTQGVNWVIRGDDLRSSTGRQIQLARLLGRTTPARFYHHSLIMKSETQKLSKADGDTGVREFRAKGWSAERIIGHAASVGGLIDRDEPVAAGAVASIPALAAAAVVMVSAGRC